MLVNLQEYVYLSKLLCAPLSYIIVDKSYSRKGELSEDNVLTTSHYCLWPSFSTPAAMYLQSIHTVLSIVMVAHCIYIK